MALLKIILIIILAVVLLRMIGRSFLPWLIKKKFLDKDNPFVNNEENQNSARSKFEGQGEYVDYEEVKDEDKKA